MYNILICDDEKDIVSALKIYLKTSGYNIYEAYNGKEALEQIKEHDIHLVLMDIMMPEMDGITAMLKIREETNLPVILLTAKSEDTDKILGLEVGADDYITKPFEPTELVARVEAVLRRCGTKSASQFRCGGLVLDEESHTVTADGESVALTYKEFELLRLFLSHPGTAFSRDQLMADVWGTDYCGETRTVDMHIRTLRQKLGAYGEKIETVRGVGYRMEGKA